MRTYRVFVPFREPAKVIQFPDITMIEKCTAEKQH
jgi:hypothetical protein